MQVTLSNAISAAITCPAVTYCFTGSPGSGKTFKTRAQFEAAGYTVIMVPCQNLPIEDTAMLPKVTTSGTVEFVPNEMWRPLSGKKYAIILDELFKAPDDVKNAFLPLLWGAPRQMQGFNYPADTIVVITANSAEFGAGDAVLPHIINRLCMLDIADTPAEDAFKDMLTLGFDSRIIEWAKRDAAALVSYNAGLQNKVDGELMGYYGFLESRPTEPFCSMRSLHDVSRILASGMPSSVTRDALIAGRIGSKAAKSLGMFLDEVGQFVSIAEMLAAPLSAPIPKKLFDQRLAAMSAASAFTNETGALLIEYVKRLPKDIQYGVFLPAVAAKPDMQFATIRGYAAMVEASYAPAEKKAA